MNFLTTIESEDEIEPEVVSDDEEEDSEVVQKGSPQSKRFKRSAEAAVQRAKKRKAFAIEFDDDNLFRSTISKSKALVNVADVEEDEVCDGGEGEDDDDEDGGTSGNVRAMPRTEERASRAQEKASRTESKKVSQQQAEEVLEEQRAAAYFDQSQDAPQPEGVMFSQLGLSRPLLRAIAAAGYVSPTPVQTKVIPLALAGRDVCASAVTGSGKTAAFVLPFLERLLFKPKDIGAIRVLVVTPTRELATQIYDVLQKLARFTSVTCCLICGGKKDLKSQAVTLRLRPDVVVGTPGRIIDHLRNSASVSVDELDVLVLDEVDRLLDLGFQEEIEELVRHCPESRQTLLFSATMTTKVEDLVRLSLRRPVRVKTEGGGICLP